MPKSRLEIREDDPERAAWLVVPLESGWVVEYKLGLERDGAVGFSEMRLHGGKGDVDARLLRTIPVRAHRELLTEHVNEIANFFGTETIRSAVTSVLDRLVRLGPAETKPGERRPDVFFARIAQRYTELVAAGVRRPVPQIADEIGRSASSVAAALSDARRMKLLTDAPTRARPGGKLTAKARRLLEQTRDEEE